MATNLNIVVVEDNQDLRLTIVDVLKREGHRVVGVDSAESVPEILAIGLIDLMVIDLNLPGEDGLSLTRRLRKSNPNIGVIVATARAHPDQKVEGYESGADIYLTKPLSLSELIAAVNAIARRLRVADGKEDMPAQELLLLNVSQLSLVGPTGIPVSLSAAEAALLSGFCFASGSRLEKWQILFLLKRENAQDQLAAVELMFVRLRKKIKSTGIEQPSIKVIRNWGYQLCVPIKTLG